MHRERVSENVYWFQSEVYAQVTAGAVTGPQWAVVIDTLAIPDETLAMRGFIEEQLGVPVRYVINTHYHADHTWGNCFFPGATIISSALCRELMQQRGPESLDAARKQNPPYRQSNGFTRIFPPGCHSQPAIEQVRIWYSFRPPRSQTEGFSIMVEDRVLLPGSILPLPYMVDATRCARTPIRRSEKGARTSFRARRHHPARRDR